MQSFRLNGLAREYRRFKGLFQPVEIRPNWKERKNETEKKWKKAVPGSYLVGVVFNAFQRYERYDISICDNDVQCVFISFISKWRGFHQSQGTLHSEDLWSLGRQGQGSGACACRAARRQSCSDLRRRWAPWKPRKLWCQNPPEKSFFNKIIFPRKGWV